MTCDKKEEIQMIDSLDCHGTQAMHVLELRGTGFHFLLVVGNLAQFRLYQWIPKEQSDQSDLSPPSNTFFSQQLRMSASNWKCVGIYSDDEDDFKFEEKKYATEENPSVQ